MKKKHLQFEIELDFSLVGISCHLKDYRFVWLLNKALKSNFIQTKQFYLNDSEHATDKDRAHVEPFLKKLFPEKASFEK